MNSKIILDRTKKILKGIPPLLKEIISLPNFWSYAGLSIILTTFFWFMTLPYEVAVKNMLQEAGDSMGKEFHIGNIDLNLFSNSTINNTRLVFSENSELKTSDFAFNFAYRKLLFSNALQGDIKISTFNLTIDDMSIKASIECAIDLMLDSFIGSPEKGMISPRIQNVSIKGLTVKGFDIPPVTLKLIDGEIIIKKKKIKFDDIFLTGPTIKGKISGRITLSDFLQHSVLDLKISIASDSSLLDNYRVLLDSLPEKRGYFVLKIKGTIADPKIELPGA